MDHFTQIYARQLKRKKIDFRSCDLDSKKPYFHKLKNGKIGDQEAEIDYAWYIQLLIELEQTEVIRCEDQNENENEDEDEEVVYENDEDPQYLMFLDNLTEHGKAYKLKISQNDDYVYYEEPDDSDWCDELQTSTDNSGDGLTVSEDLQINQKGKKKLNTKKEVPRRKKIRTQRDPGMIFDGCYQRYINSLSELVAVKTEEDLEEYGKNITTSDSDSDIMILDNVQIGSEVKNKQLVVAEQESVSLREKLLDILRQPYNVKEHEELSEYIEQKKPICRHLDLRGRSISSAVQGMEKSVLDDGPGSFKTLFSSSQNDPPKALNLLRMFRFWLEHIPNEDLYEPWRDKHILKVRPEDAPNEHDAAYG